MYDSIGAAIDRWLRATSSKHRPWQVAAAVACGALAGVCLTTSPLGVLLLACLFCAPVHFLLTSLVAVVVACASAWWAPNLETLGAKALAVPEVVTLVGALHDVPGVGWLRLNNTLVHGSLVCGLAQWLPTLLASWWIAISLRECADEHQTQHASTEFASDQHAREWEEISTLDATASDPSPTLTDTGLQQEDWVVSDLDFQPFQESVEELDVAASQATLASEADAQNTNASLHSDEVSEDSGQPEPEDDWERRTQDTVSRLEAALDSARGAGTAGDAMDVAGRAAQLASLVDEMLEMLKQSDAPDTAHGFDDANTHITPGDAHCQDKTAFDNEPHVSHLRPHDSDAMNQEQARLCSHEAHAELAGPTAKDQAALDAVSENEQALRYLLHHLRKINNRV